MANRWKTRIGIVGAEHGDRRTEPDPIGLTGDRGEHRFGRRHGEVVAMVFADAEEVDADLVGEHAFGDDVADDLCVRQRLAVGADGDVAERVDAEFECGSVSSGFAMPVLPECLRLQVSANRCAASRIPASATSDRDGAE